MRATPLVAGAAAVTICVVAAGCGLPHHKDLDVVSKRAITSAAAAYVIERFNGVRRTAEREGDARLLGAVEAGSLLAVDRGVFQVQSRLRLASQPSAQLADADDILAPELTGYPLWFVATADVPAERHRAVVVFSRASSTSPWLMTAAPRLALATTLPAAALNDQNASAQAVAPTDSRGLPASPLQIVSRYAEFLANPNSAHAHEFVEDSFLSQMRRLQGAQPAEDVTFTQSWAAQPLRYVLRLDDGGILILATLVRTDTYRVEGNGSLSWRSGSEASAYFPKPVRDSAVLTYEHQVLMVVPAGEKPVVVGQYGGLVNAVGGVG